LDTPPAKRAKRAEALQELVHIRPDLKRKAVYFFPRLDKCCYFEGVLMFDATKKKAFVYDAKTDYKFETFSKWIDVLGSRGYFKGKRSALVTVFLEPNPSSPNIASILRVAACIADVLSSIREMAARDGELAGTGIREIEGGVELRFFGQNGYEVRIHGRTVRDDHLPSPTNKMMRNILDVIDIIRFIFSKKICAGQSTKGLSFIHVI